MQTDLFDHSDTEPELEQIDWSFNGVQTDYLTHGLHGYPARMIPQIPKRLLNYWLSKGILTEYDLVFDPFCGSGTTATEARLHNLNVFSTDINPFACLLSRTKCTPLDVGVVEAAINRCLGPNWTYRERFIDENHNAAAQRHPTKWGSDIYPENDSTNGYTNQNHHAYSVKKGWFPEPQIDKIEAMSRLLTELRGEYDYQTIRFLRICLSQTARKISYQRDSEFKRHRIPEKERSNHNPKFTETFANTLHENLKRINDYNTQVGPETEATIKLADCRDRNVLEANSADAALTSPPYGDHSTTVGYGQFCQAPAAAATPLKADWMKDVDPSGLGGHSSVASLEFETVVEWSPALEKTLETLREKDGRDEDVLKFFTDYAESLIQISRVVKPGQPVAIVVGNRTVSRTPIPTHIITTEIGQEIGLKHEQSFARSIPSKTLPYENAPENVSGKSGSMIADEYVLLFQSEEGHPESF